MRGGISEPYTLSEIYVRDLGICGICKEEVILGAELKRDTPSMDHIYPIYYGGNDTKDNIQLAHFGCNARKRHNV